MFCLIFSLFSFNKYKNTGSVQTFTAPISTSYKLEVWGAQGGGNGGKGGYSIGNISLISSNNLYIYVGGKGGNNSDIYNGGSGGYNGGGDGGNGHTSHYGGAGGGGATHIAITTNRGELKNYVNNKSEIRIVAGGGGGLAVNAQGNGHGGGTNGNSTQSCGWKGAGIFSIPGGTQTTGYAFGQGQNGITNTVGGLCGEEGAGGGGGGWYGGFASQVNGGDGSSCSGAGGSGYIGGVTNGTTTAGIQTGNGKALITWMPVL